MEFSYQNIWGLFQYIWFRKKMEVKHRRSMSGIKIANGEYIAFCDQDDWWLPGKLQKQIIYLKSHPETGMVYSDAYMGDEVGNILKRTWMQSRSVIPRFGGYDNCAAELFRRNFVCAPLVMLVRKKVFDAIGSLMLSG